VRSADIDRASDSPGRLIARPFAPPVRDPRFWFVQFLVVGITITHTAVELAERDSGLTGFWDGIHHLPVPAYIVPVLLASFWGGMSGGLLTGLVTMLLSVPNAIVFHSENYSWLGEIVTNALVLAVGLTVAFVVEQDVRLRQAAERNSRRLRTLWDVAGTLGRYDREQAVVSDVVGRLATSPGVDAAGFLPHSTADKRGVVASGSDDALALIKGTAESNPAGQAAHGDLLTFEVATTRRTYGTLLLACATEGRCDDDAVVFSLVARELAHVMENLEHREQERSELQRYARAVTVAQETERLRIARELHDGPSQSMIVLKRGLEHLTSQAPNGPIDVDRTAELKHLVQDTLRSLQRTTQALRPPVLDDLGLGAAVRSLAERRTARGVIQVALEIEGDERRLAPDVELAAYRIAQEALTNVERHARSDSALVRLRFEHDSLGIEISDTGVGVELDEARDHAHFGLVGMRERAELAGGSFAIDSAPGSGTRVVVEIPTPSGGSTEAP
jgi:signal transduction histidine kinase